MALYYVDAPTAGLVRVICVYTCLSQSACIVRDVFVYLLCTCMWPHPSERQAWYALIAFTDIILGAFEAVLHCITASDENT